jgi:glycosyltransferase involved in cell wall biosynthesis
VNRVLIYAPRVLPPSQTFIAEQARALQRWQPVLTGRQLDPRGPDVHELLAPGGVPDPSRSTVLRQRMTRRVAHLPSVVAETKPELIHAHFLTGGIDVTRTLTSLPCPLVVTGHGFDVTQYGTPSKTLRPSRLLLGHLRRDLLRRHDVHFLAVSRFLADELVNLGADQSRVAVHYTGVDTGYFQPAPARPTPAGPGVVLFVGRLVHQKGARDLLTAFARLGNDLSAPQLRVIGDGPERTQLEVLAEQLRIDVRFDGSQPPTVVRDALRDATVLCVPSRTDPRGDREGLGMVFLEAQAMGIPVVATTSGGIPEAVSDGTTGLLVPEGDIARLAEALRACLRDSDLHRRLAAAGRPWVLKHFDLRQQTQRLESLYDEWVS